jgi:glycosyltransferase involved in cell wall biosynthesis
MRIGFVNSGTLQQNASTIRCLRLGRRLVGDGHEVLLFLPGHRDNVERFGAVHDGMQMRYSEAGRGREQLGMIRLLSAERLDVIHCMSAGSSVHFPAWIGKLRQRNRPCLIMDFDEWQSLWLRYPKRAYQRAWEWFACKASDRVLFASRDLLHSLGHRVPEDRRFYLPYAVDLQRFSADSRGWESIRERYPGRRLAVYMGSLLPQFNVERVLEAVKEVCRREPDVLFLFIGAGKLRDTLERTTRESGLTEWVRFLGYLDDREMTQHLCAADALLFPIEDTLLNRSRSPNKTFQYLAARRPIVTNPVGNVHDVLGEHALYFDFDSTSDFAEKIIKAIQDGGPLPPESLCHTHSWEVRYARYLEILGASMAARDRVPALRED